MAFIPESIKLDGYYILDEEDEEIITFSDDVEQEMCFDPYDAIDDNWRIHEVSLDCEGRPTLPKDMFTVYDFGSDNECRWATLKVVPGYVADPMFPYYKDNIRRWLTTRGLEADVAIRWGYNRNPQIQKVKAPERAEWERQATAHELRECKEIGVQIISSVLRVDRKEYLLPKRLFSARRNQPFDSSALPEFIINRNCVRKYVKRLESLRRRSRHGTHNNNIEVIIRTIGEKMSTEPHTLNHSEANTLFEEVKRLQRGDENLNASRQRIFNVKQ